MSIPSLFMSNFGPYFAIFLLDLQDKKIKELEEQIKILQKGNGTPSLLPSAPFFVQWAGTKFCLRYGSGDTYMEVFLQAEAVLCPEWQSRPL